MVNSRSMLTQYDKNAEYACIVVNHMEDMLVLSLQVVAHGAMSSSLEFIVRRDVCLI
jgi:hypothetical protein